MQSLPKQELAYLAAIFHDIAKGRGGDHSELGVGRCRSVLSRTGTVALRRAPGRLAGAQSPGAVGHGAEEGHQRPEGASTNSRKLVGDQNHLDYLYVLTVADVRGTNPKLWNNWKASLFAEFYERTQQALRRGLESPIDKDELIAETQARARELLDARRRRRSSTCKRSGSASPMRISCGTRPRKSPGTRSCWRSAISDDIASLVSVQQQSGRGGTGISTYTPQTQHSFARTTALLDQLGLNIVDARITPTADGFSLDVYHVLEDTGAEITDPVAHSRHRAAARARAGAGRMTRRVTVTRRAPRQVRMFTTPTQITFSEDPVNQRTIVELIAGDRPGLLSQIAKVFMAERVDIYTSKIMTVGERAEDVFYVARRIRPAAQRARRSNGWRSELTETLDRRA